MSDEDLFFELRERGRSVTRTPTSQRRRKHAPPRTPAQRGRSRSRGIQPKVLNYRSNSNKPARVPLRSDAELARPTDERLKFDLYHLNKGKSMYQIDMLWKRRKSGKYKLKTRKVRHKNARSTLKKMPRGGKPYAKSTRRPKGKAGYRGVLTPKWMKGETKHVLVSDGAKNDLGLTAAGKVYTAEEYRTAVGSYTNDHSTMDIGSIAAWSLNPVGQGLTREDRNGQSIDGTYCRIQGHIHNVSKDATTTGDATSVGGKQRCYVRMLVLAVKGGRGTGSDRPVANFDKEQLFKKIDGSVAPFDTTLGTTGKASSRVRSLQLGVNKAYYTLLADRKFELSGSEEGFGSSDRLFDFKIPLKQKTTFSDGHVDSWEKNQIVLVAMTVDPNMNDSVLAVDGSGNPSADGRRSAIQIEFESKYSYKDF